MRGSAINFWQSHRQYFSRFATQPGGRVDLAVAYLPHGPTRRLAEIHPDFRAHEPTSSTATTTTRASSMSDPLLDLVRIGLGEVLDDVKLHVAPPLAREAVHRVEVADRFDNLPADEQARIQARVRLRSARAFTELCRSVSDK